MGPACPVVFVFDIVLLMMHVNPGFVQAPVLI